MTLGVLFAKLCNGHFNGHHPPPATYAPTVVVSSGPVAVVASSARLDAVIKRLDEAQVENTRACRGVLDTVLIVRQERAHAHELVKATLECDCPPESEEEHHEAQA